MDEQPNNLQPNTDPTLGPQPSPGDSIQPQENPLGAPPQPNPVVPPQNPEVAPAGPSPIVPPQDPTQPPQVQPQVFGPSFGSEVPPTNPQVMTSPQQNGSKPKKGILLVILIVIIVVLGVVAYLALHKTSKPAVSSNVQNTQSSQGADSTALQDQDNTLRMNDVSAINGAISTYISDNTGALPESTNTSAGSVHVFEVCGTSCSGTITPISAKLGYYEAGNISIVSYSSDLAIKNTSTVYIVNNASCNGDAIGSQTSASASSAAVLFALQKGSSLEQQCQQA